MGMAVKRKNQKIGGSNFLNIPKPTGAGKESTIVSGPLLLADPEGEISKEELEDFFEEKVAPAWYAWREKHGK